MSHPRNPRRGAAAPFDMLAAAQRVADTTPTDRAATLPLDDVELPPRLDRAGRRISRQQTSQHPRRGVPPANKGKTYDPDPPTVAECMALLNACGPGPHGRRRFAAITLSWQGALRSFETLALTEDDLDDQTGRLLIRHGKGDKRATITMAAWAWPFLEEWRAIRRELPNPRGPLICVIDPPTAGLSWETTAFRAEMRALCRAADVKRRVSPHQFRHAWAAQAYTDGVPLRTIQLHLRHAHIGVTDTYLRGLGLDISREQVYQLPVPTVPATALLAAANGGSAR